MTNTIFEDKGHTHASVVAENPVAILIQDCQFLVNKVIDIESKYVPKIRMANCFISVIRKYPGYNSYPIIDSKTKVLLRVWNVTIYDNNTYYTSGNEDFGYYIGHKIVVRESCFAAGITHSK